MTTAGPNYISGITTATFQNTDVVNKSYVDGLSGSLPSQTGNAGEFLTTTDGTSISWDYVSNYQEFSATGSPQTFTVPSQANILYVEAVGAGGGGSTGTTGSTFAKNGLTWSLRTSGFGNTTISNITTSGSTYVASGSSYLASSTDNITWISRTSGFGTSNINGLTYSNNEYLIGTGGNSQIWTQRTVVGSNSLIDFTFGNGFYLAGGYGTASVQVSTNAIQWSLRTSANAAPASLVESMVFGGGIYVVGDSWPQIRTSTNTINWTLRTGGSLGSGVVATLAYSVTPTEKYVGGKNVGAVISSTDSISWTLRTSGFGTSAINALVYGSNVYIAATIGGAISVSTDAIAWTLRTSGFGTSTINTLAYNESNLYVAAGAFGTLLSSTDTIAWTLRTSGFGTSAINALVYGSNVYIAGGASGTNTFSTDAIIWTLRTSGFGTTSINSLLFDGTNTFIQSSISSNTLSTFSTIISATLSSSTDAVSWSLRTFNTGSQTITLLSSFGYYSLAHGTDYFTEYKLLSVSTNNIIWQLRTSGFGSNQITSFGYDGTSYLAGGASGTLTVSTDTITWILRTSGFGTTLIDALTYGNGTYVAGGVSGTLTTSTDTIVWTLRNTGNGTDTINSLSYSNTASNFIFSGDFGDIFTSTNAIVWKVNTSSTTANLLTSVHVNNTYLVAGASGTLSQADTQLSGTGGSGGSYTSWYIPKPIVTSNVTVNIGVGGTGATTESTSGSVGAGTTISWTGPGGTYTLTSSGGDAFKNFSFVNRPRTATIFGTSSSSPSRIILPTNPRLDLSTSNFTVEFWLKTNGTQSANATIIDSGTANNSVYIGIGANMSSIAGKVSFKVGDTYPTINGATTVTDGVWRHIACVKSGSDVYIFVNGVIDASSPSSAVNSIASFSDGRIGGSRWSTGQFTDNGIVASLSNFRISNIARYTSTFSPFTTKFSVDTNTVLFLPLDSLPSIDLSSNQFVLDTQGASLTTETAIFQPFNYFYTTAGRSGGISTTGIGVTATAQANSFQSTGGGSGAGTPSSAGGGGGSITFYGNTIFSAGGSNTGSNGAVGIAITSLPYGFGGGGGGAGASNVGSGGNGTRGGGGGGAAIGSTSGNGGNGGDGFVRITWW